MAPPSRRPARTRKSTSDTLVNPPPSSNIVSSPKSWLKSFQLPRPKRSRSNGDAAAPASLTTSASDSLSPDTIFLPEEDSEPLEGDSLSDFSDDKLFLSPDASSPPTSAASLSLQTSSPTSPPRFWRRTRAGAAASAKRVAVAAADHGPSTAMVIAKALVTFGEASNIPYLKGVAGLGLLILETAEGVTSNKEDCLRLKEHVRSIIIALDGWRRRLGENIGPAQYECLEETESTFRKVSECIQRLSSAERGYASRFLMQQEDAQNILKCEKDLQHALRLFSMRTNLEVHHAVTQMGQDLESNHQQILQEVQSIGAIVGSTSTKTEQSRHLAQLGTRARFDAPMPLRSCPKIFYGRDSELEKLLRVVSADSPARVAVLGPGGIGKSTLVLRLLHHERVQTRYGSRRFFVPCDAANSADSLVAVLASHFRLPAYDAGGCADSQAVFNEVLTLLAVEEDGSGGGAVGSPREGQDGDVRVVQTILVLDNFESPWEAHGSRAEVEELLGRIADIPSLTLIVTLRGVERPREVAWTKPFLAPLSPLDHHACRRIFSDIAGYDARSTEAEAQDDDLDDLLELCGALLLAVTLMAHLADVERLPTLLRRWKRESTSMLDGGGDGGRATSLDVSVALSLSSPRLDRTPDARALLSVLALLPDGVPEDDLERAAPRIRELAKCSAALRRTALAYEDEGGRLKLLAPIRAHVAANHPPARAHVAAVEAYIWDLVRHTRGIEEGRSREAIRRVAPQINNIEAVIEWTLAENDDVGDARMAVKATVDLALLHIYTCCGRPRSLERALDCSRNLGDKYLEAECLYITAFMTHRHGKSSDSVEAWYKQAEELYRDIGDTRGEAKCLQELSIVYSMRCRKDESYAYLQRAHDMHIASSNMTGQAETLMLLGKHADSKNELKKARELYEQSLKISTETLHHLPLQAKCLQLLADGAFYSSEYPRARELSQRSIDIWTQLGMHGSAHFAASLDCLGSVCQALSRWDEAERCYRQALGVYRKVVRPDRAANALLNLAIVCVERRGTSSSNSRVLEAERYADESHELWAGLGRQWGLAMCVHVRGDIALAKREFGAARERYGEAAAAFCAAGWKSDEAGSVMKLGDVALALATEGGGGGGGGGNETGTARECFERACAMFRDAGEPLGQARCLARLGRVFSFASASDLERAERSYEDAMGIFREIGLVVEERECAAGLVDVCWRLGKPELSRKYRRLSLAPLAPSS